MFGEHYLVMKKALFALLFIGVALAGCTQRDIAPAPYVDIEATVSSVFLDDLHSDCEAPEVCPRDRVTLKIDKIDKTNYPSNKIIVGDAIEFNLKYSARPAKLRSDVPPTCSVDWTFKSGSCIREDCEGPNDCPASSPQYNEKPTEMEGSYVIYHLPQRTGDVTETILPGLEEGSKIKIRYGEIGLIRKEIGEYELIS